MCLGRRRRRSRTSSPIMCISIWRVARHTTTQSSTQFLLHYTATCTCAVSKYRNYITQRRALVSAGHSRVSELTLLLLDAYLSKLLVGAGGVGA